MKVKLIFLTLITWVVASNHCAILAASVHHHCGQVTASQPTAGHCHDHDAANRDKDHQQKETDACCVDMSAQVTQPEAFNFRHSLVFVGDVILPPQFLNQGLPVDGKTYFWSHGPPVPISSSHPIIAPQFNRPPPSFA